MSTKQRVFLKTDQRRRLEEIVHSGRAHARTINHAHMLLLCDESEQGPGWDDDRIADALNCSARTVARLRSRFNREGIDEALRVKKSGGGRRSKIEAATEAHLIALACSEPPSGYARWSLRLLSAHFVDLCEQKQLEPVARETVRQMLKKTGFSLTSKNNG